MRSLLSFLAPLRPLRVVVVLCPVGLHHLVELDEGGGQGEVDHVRGNHVQGQLLTVGGPDPPVIQWCREHYTGNLYKAVPRLQECCKQLQAEYISNNRNKIHQTWERPYRDSLYEGVWLAKWQIHAVCFIRDSL